MKCPTCSHQTRVIDTSESARGKRRRRECKHCGARFITYEIPEEELDAQKEPQQQGDEIDVAEAAEALSVSKGTIRNKARDGILPARMNNGRWLIDREAVQEYAEQRQTANGNKPAATGATQPNFRTVPGNLQGIEGLILAIIERAFRDVQLGGQWASDARQYFTSRWYRWHLDALDLPPNAMPLELQS